MDQHKGPRQLDIVWSHDRRYWQFSTDDSDKEEFAELVQVAWLEVSSEAEVERNKKYKIRFTVSMTPDAFGWSGTPVFIMAKIGKTGKYVAQKVNLAGREADTEFDIPGQGLVIETTSTDSKIYFGLYEIWSGNWKGGLRIHSAHVEEVPEKV